MGEYRITVATRNEWYAGTDADVAINLYSGNQQTGNLGLNNNGNDRRAGATDVYTVTGPDLEGPIDSVELVMSGNDEWKPGMVTVEDLTSRLVWRADFSDLVGISSEDEGDGAARGFAVKPARVFAIDSGRPILPDQEQKESIADQWYEGLKAAVAGMSMGASNAKLVIATQLIKLVEARSGSKVNFVTLGLAAALNPVAVLGGEAGYIHRVHGSIPDFATEAGRYLSVTHGVEFDIGASGGLAIGVWTAPSLEKMEGWTFGRSYVVGAGLSVALTLLWPDQADEARLNPSGVQVSALISPSVLPMPGTLGSSFPYTWVWPAK